MGADGHVIPIGRWIVKIWETNTCAVWKICGHGLIVTFCGRIHGFDSCRAITWNRPYGIQLIPIDEDVEGGVGRNLLDRGEFGRIASAWAIWRVWQNLVSLIGSFGATRPSMFTAHFSVLKQAKILWLVPCTTREASTRDHFCTRPWWLWSSLG